ncbi:SLBB domain-containing protein [Spirulina subsalsa FACHB-351]|uniref:SLBB domain-containing protein n=1 Tax=Spirulina subsalsa FACHB-351 TaxID=234711 RepID=A0ABT3L514_9CYAN|nr:SLBB domain-containing protein [Spirulina subsalsa]MCW6036583.1 SLBB domain-containing protein [Spirulina subsalsa FACHB-351]
MTHQPMKIPSILQGSLLLFLLLPLQAQAQIPTFTPLDLDLPTPEEAPLNPPPWDEGEPPEVTPPEVAPAFTPSFLPPNLPYTLGAGDRVRLDIFNVPEYSGEYPVLIDGTLNLPLIGTIPVADLTLQQAADLLSQRYALYLTRPIVTLGLLRPRPVRLAIAGEVQRPGSYTVTVDEGRQFPTVTELIALAEGITLSADVRQVRIRRTYQGVEQTYTVDLWQLLQAGELGQDIPLRDGDALIIPTAMAINPQELRQLADASFAPDAPSSIQIAIVGEVVRPGTHTLRVDALGVLPTVTTAIKEAGGITTLANVRNIELRRTPRNGQEETIQVDLWELLQSGDLSQDVLLQPGDRIVVAQAPEIDSATIGTLTSATFSPNTVRVNVVGEVNRGGTLELPPNTPLNQAILAAGGFNNRARKSRVELVRLNPNGTVSRQEFAVDLTQGIDNENNPVLLNNDVVVVNRSFLARTTDTLTSVLAPVGGFVSFINFFRIFGFLN